jgi:hypothetical protein
MNGTDGGLPFEHFIQAITSQLDRAQRAMAIKAKNGNLPLTFAVKDLSLDLRTHVELRGSAVYLRPAGPGETDASTVHLNLTTITRPMIEENAVSLDDDPDEPALDDVLGDDDGRPGEREELRRRLEWAGIHRVSQLRRLQEQRQEGVLQRVTQLPLSQLRTALTRVSVPRLTQVIKQPLSPAPPVNILPTGPRSNVTLPTPNIQPAPTTAPPPVLHIRGDNLVRGVTPVVRLRGQPIPVLRATPQEIVAAPPTDDLSGMLALEVEPGVVLETDLGPARPSSAPSPPEPESNGGQAS